MKISRKVDPELGYSVQQALGDNVYIPHRYPGRLTLFHADQRNPDLYYDPYMGWGGLAADGIEVHEISGTHIDAYKEPNVQVWVAQVKSCLERGKRTAN